MVASDEEVDRTSGDRRDDTLQDTVAIDTSCEASGNQVMGCCAEVSTAEGSHPWKVTGSRSRFSTALARSCTSPRGAWRCFGDTVGIYSSCISWGKSRDAVGWTSPWVEVVSWTWVWTHKPVAWRYWTVDSYRFSVDSGISRGKGCLVNEVGNSCADVRATISWVYAGGIHGAAEGEVATPEVVGVVKLHFIVSMLGNRRRDKKVLRRATECRSLGRSERPVHHINAWGRIADAQKLCVLIREDGP